MLRVPTIPRQIADWYRDAANGINALQVKSVLKDGATTYTAPTASGTYSQAEMQALMDAVEALSDRLK